MDSHLEVIDAFIDAERVDPAALKLALSDPAGLDYFVDAWMLREAVQQDRDMGPREPAVDRHPAVVPAGRTASKWTVAAALLVGVAGGYLAGHRTSQPASLVSPPAVTTVASAPARPVFPAPPPTRIIQLEFQADSTKSGGH